MKPCDISRRQFIGTSAALAGTALLSPLGLSPARAASTQAAAQAVKRTAIDQVTLGKTGLKLSRLGIGTGVHNGRDLVALGKEAFVKLVRYAYDQGITYVDAASQYATFNLIGDAIKGLPREKIFLQSKVSGQPADVLAEIDRHRKTYNTDYIDSLLDPLHDGRRVDRQVQAGHGRLQRGQGEEVDPRQGRFLPQPARPARRRRVRLQRGPPRPRQPAGHVHRRRSRRRRWRTSPATTSPR